MKEFCEKWWKRIATKEMVFIGIVTLAASIIASWLKQFPGFSLFGALIIALLIGMVLQFPIRKWYSSRSPEHKAGVKDAAGLISNKLLRLGIILLGFKLNLQVLFTQGIKCLPIAAVVVTLTIVVCYNIARKLGVDPQKQLAKWAAIRYSSEHILDYIELQDDHAIMEVTIPPEWMNRTSRHGTFRIHQGSTGTGRRESQQ